MEAVNVYGFKECTMFMFSKQADEITFKDMPQMPSRSWEEARNDFHHDLISNFNQTLPESLMHSGKLGIVEFACGMIPVPVQHSVPLHCRGWDLLEGRLNRRRICQNLSKIISEFKVFVEAEELVKLIFNKRLSFTDFGFCQDLAETADKSDCNVPKKKRDVRKQHRTFPRHASNVQEKTGFVRSHQNHW